MQRYFAKNIEDNKITLSNSDMHHIKNVMRMKENDKVEVVYDKKTYLCNLDNNLELHIDTVINEDKELLKEQYRFIRDSQYAQYRALNLGMGYLMTGYLASNKDIKSEYFKPEASHIFGNILIDVNPGNVFISFK